MITISVENQTGNEDIVDISKYFDSNLMEALRGLEYPILATCGGMALCATCHVEILKGADQISPPEDMELDTIDTLPNAGPASRLSCQIRVEESLNGIMLRIRGDED